MRKLITAALAGATVAGGVAITQSAAAQPYYYGPPPAYSDPYRYSYPDRYYPYDNRYGSSSSAGILGSVLGSVLGLNYGSSFYSRVPVDQYGPDPNGMIGPDGRRIKCKLRRNYDRYYGGYVVQRECRATGRARY
jgi:hypothetical protein